MNDAIRPIDQLNVEIMRQEPDEREQWLWDELARMRERHQLEIKPIVDMLARITAMRINPMYIVRVDPQARKQ